jgi:hypothetical protein
MPEQEPQACMPCRGTGRVISNLGGEQRSVQCPWCGGDGQRHAGADAQAAWVQGDGHGQDGQGGEDPVESAADVEQ